MPWQPRQLRPGERVPPLSTVTAPAMLPWPPNLADAPTSTAPLPLLVPLTNKVPLEICVAPI